MSSIIITNAVVAMFMSKTWWRLQGKRLGIYDAVKLQNWK